MNQYSSHFDVVVDVDGCCYVQIGDAVEKRTQVGVHGEVLQNQTSDRDAAVVAAAAVEGDIGFVDNVAAPVDAVGFESDAVVGGVVVVFAVFPLPCVCEAMKFFN